MSNDRSLPTGWCKAALPDVASVNPPNPVILPEDDDLVSFVPMASVEAISGRLTANHVRPWNQVKKGYTRFQEDDILFAKITPCMENGKAAIAKGLSGGIGAGSTEFHVLRVSDGLRPELLLHYVLQEDFRRAARAQMTGTSGQLRVPARFFDQGTRFAARQRSACLQISSLSCALPLTWMTSWCRSASRSAVGSTAGLRSNRCEGEISRRTRFDGWR